MTDKYTVNDRSLLPDGHHLVLSESAKRLSRDSELSPALSFHFDRVRARKGRIENFVSGAYHYLVAFASSFHTLSGEEFLVITDSSFGQTLVLLDHDDASSFSAAGVLV